MSDFEGPRTNPTLTSQQGQELRQKRLRLEQLEAEHDTLQWRVTWAHKRLQKHDRDVVLPRWMLVPIAIVLSVLIFIAGGFGDYSPSTSDKVLVVVLVCFVAPLFKLILETFWVEVTKGIRQRERIGLVEDYSRQRVLCSLLREDLDTTRREYAELVAPSRAVDLQNPPVDQTHSTTIDQAPREERSPKTTPTTQAAPRVESLQRSFEWRNPPGGADPRQPKPNAVAPNPSISGTARHSKMPPQSEYQTGARIIDWEEVNAQRKRTGLEGEEIVVLLEQQYLRSIGRTDLADQVLHISATAGDGAGYDVQSFFDDGSPKYIEVKTTVKDVNAAFHLSRNEHHFLENNPHSAFLYRVSLAEDPPSLRVFSSNEFFESTQLTATQYLVRMP